MVGNVDVMMSKLCCRVSAHSQSQSLAWQIKLSSSCMKHDIRLDSLVDEGFMQKGSSFINFHYFDKLNGFLNRVAQDAVSIAFLSSDEQLYAVLSRLESSGMRCP